MDNVITSLKNPKVKLARGLSNNRKLRRRERAFFIEGAHAVTSAQRNRWDLRFLYYSPEMPLSDWAQSMISKVPEDRRVRRQRLCTGTTQ